MTLNSRHKRERPTRRPAGSTAKDIVRIAREFSDAAPRAIYYAGRRSSWYREDFQMHRAQAILNAVVGSWDRQGGMFPAQKIALGEYMFLPWDDVTTSPVDEIDKKFPLVAKTDGSYLNLRENVLSASPYPVKAWMVHKQDPMNALPEQSKTIRMADFDGIMDSVTAVLVLAGGFLLRYIFVYAGQMSTFD